jgi:hypothetical protein
LSNSFGKHCIDEQISNGFWSFNRWHLPICIQVAKGAKGDAEGSGNNTPSTKPTFWEGDLWLVNFGFFLATKATFVRIATFLEGRDSPVRD